MGQVNLTKTDAKDLALQLIQRLDAIEAQHIDALKKQFAALRAELAAMLPDWTGQARYQKLRVICSDKRKMRAFRDGRIKL